MTWSGNGQNLKCTALHEVGSLAACEHARVMLEAKIRARILLLGKRWECCGPFDRILAVRRVLREGDLSAVTSRELAAIARTTERHFSSSREANARGDRVRGLQHELELQLAERRRDEVLVRSGSVESLLRCAESYLLERPYDRENPTLRELFEHRARLEAAHRRLRARALIEGTLSPSRAPGPNGEPHSDASLSSRRSHGALGSAAFSIDGVGKRRAASAAP